MDLPVVGLGAPRRVTLILCFHPSGEGLSEVARQPVTLIHFVHPPGRLKRRATLRFCHCLANKPNVKKLPGAIFHERSEPAG